MKTRNIFFLFFILFSTISTKAQLKVNTDGSISSGYSGYSNLNLSNNGTTSSDGTVWGKWAFEVWGENLNLWKPWPSANNGEINYYMFLTPAGGVGIGKVPTHTGICLDVKGHVYANNYMLTSDERLKTDIKSLTNETNLIYNLNGKSYRKKSIEDEVNLPDIIDDKGNIIKKQEKSKYKNKNAVETNEFGFIAQELKEIYPELVNQDTLGYYYVNYIGLIPVLVEALKEQKVKIATLRYQINNSNSGPKKIAGTTSIGNIESDVLSYPVLDQNVPNPFNISTSINYYLPSTVSTASIYIYDMNGTQLKSYSISQRGKGSVTIHGSEFSAGMYLYALITDGKVIDTKRMILTK